MRKMIIGGSVLGAGLSLAALIGLSSLASASGGTPSPSTAKVEVTCGAEAIPPAGVEAKGGSEQGAVSSVEAAEAGPSFKKEGAPAGKDQPMVTSKAEMKDGKLFVDGKEVAVPEGCEDGAMTVSISDAATKAP